MRIATWNVNSLKARLEKVEWWLDRARPDVLLLQETKLSDPDAPVMSFGMAGYQLVHHGEGRWNGVAIAVRNGLAVADVETNFGDGPVRDSGAGAEMSQGEEDFDPFDEARIVAAGFADLGRFDAATVRRSVAPVHRDGVLNLRPSPCVSHGVPYLVVALVACGVIRAALVMAREVVQEIDLPFVELHRVSPLTCGLVGASHPPDRPVLPPTGDASLGARRLSMTRGRTWTLYLPGCGPGR